MFNVYFQMNEKLSELLAQILHAEEVNKASTNSPKTKPDSKFKFREPKRDTVVVIPRSLLQHTVKIPEEVIFVLFTYCQQFVLKFCL